MIARVDGSRAQACSANLDRVNTLLPVLLPTLAVSCDAQAAYWTLTDFTGPSKAKG